MFNVRPTPALSNTLDCTRIRRVSTQGLSDYPYPYQLLPKYVRLSYPYLVGLGVKLSFKTQTNFGGYTYMYECEPCTGACWLRYHKIKQKYEHFDVT